MEKDQSVSVKEAVHKIQLSLLEGIRHEKQLFAAGSLMSRSDFEDVVTERFISNLCGYPLCNNPLPSERPRKGRYRISLKEHKVYDLQETYMYCSSGCLINSRAFAGSLQTERCSISSSAKINEVLGLFTDSSLYDEVVLGKNGDLGFSDLKIQEKVDTRVVGEVSVGDWVGPSDAIEGYVPKDRSLKSSHLKVHKEGSKNIISESKKGTHKAVNEMDFTSTIIMVDQFNVPKTSCDSLLNGSKTQLEESEGEVSSKVMGEHVSISNTSPAPVLNDSVTNSKESRGEMSGVTTQFQSSSPELFLDSSQNVSDTSVTELKREACLGETSQSNESTLKSSLKSSGAKKLTRSVTWADERKISSLDNGNLCSVREFGDVSENVESVCSLNREEDITSLRFASAEACAIALSEAAETVASGEFDVSNAVSQAGITILPHPHDADGDSEDTDGDSDDADGDFDDADGDSEEEVAVVEPEFSFKWSNKLGFLQYEITNPEYSWYDTMPEGFSLTLSSFASMWAALFGWITSSSLAYIYGRDESSHEEFLLINGREYPRKITLGDGRSDEIKQTLAGCLAQALPGLVTDLRLPTPISTLEQGLGCLLDTMSFVDALPPFRTKQWHVIILLFIEALSVCRFPALTPHMTSRRMLLHKVLDGAQVSGEEFETLRDLIIPLGRLPQFSTQSGA